MSASNAFRAIRATPCDGALANALNPLKDLERAMGIEPTTRSLGSYCSTTELHPRCKVFLPYRGMCFRRISA